MAPINSGKENGVNVNVSDISSNSDTIAKNDQTPAKSCKSLRFWAIFAVLCILSFLSSLDVSIISQALPTIIQDTGGEDQYVWITNCFILASCVPQPLFGQVANIFGRRGPVITAVTLFAIGSGIAGAAHSPAALMTGRSVQGLGAGGIYVLIDIICCDLVPLRERGQYLGYIFAFAGLGAVLGPIVGGALATAGWRWIFFLNLPICGLALAIIIPFLRFKYTRSMTLRAAFGRIDLLGSGIFMVAMILLLSGLVMGGVRYSWSSWQILLPISLGVLCWALFHLHQASSWCKEPSVPPRLFQNRTSATAYALTCLSSIILQAITVFLPLYFQGVRGDSALGSGIKSLPFCVPLLVWAILAGGLLSHFGRYRPLHLAGFALNALALGLFSLWESSSPTAVWAGFQVIAAAGSGFILSTLLPAIMAALPESDVAAASSFYSFTRSFGQIWGVALSAIVFNAAFDSHLYQIENSDIRAQLTNGAAYAFAGHQSIARLSEPTRSEVISVYAPSLRMVWYVMAALSCIAVALVALEREIPLRQNLETEYGLDNAQDSNNVGYPASSSVSQHEKGPNHAQTRTRSGTYSIQV